MSDYSPQSFSMLPPAVKNLMIINVLFFAATYVFESVYHSSIPAMLCLYPIGSGLFRIWQPFTYMFMHGGLDHIFFNMFALWMFGYVLENYWGSKRFLLYYLACGLGGAIASLLLPGFHITLGASGAVYGILLAFGMMFPEERIYLYFIMPIKAKWFVTAYAAIELIEGVFRTSDGIGHFAHLGGMIVGFCIIMIWRQHKKNQFRRY